MDALNRTPRLGHEIVDVSTAARVFAGEGEMATRSRGHDWSATPLGPVEQWPPALRTAVRLMLASPVATSLWCGSSYTLLYNDAYRRILGAKHPRALGHSGAMVWDELWPALEPQFEQVRSGGAPIFADDALLRMERLEGKRAEDAWFTYSLSALTDEDGTCLAVYNVAVEVTERARAEREREAERTRLTAVFEQSPSFLAVLRGPDDVFELANDAYFKFIGRGREIIGKPLFEALPEVRGQGFEANHRRVRETGEPLVIRDLRVLIQRTPHVPPEERFMDVTYLPLVEPDGSHTAVIAHGADVTDQVRARREVERLLAESEMARQALEAVNAQLQDQALELELVNQQLQDNAVELELQAEELQATAAQLEERTEIAEEARRRSEAVLGSIGDAFYLLDRQWRFTHVNDAAEPLLQTTRARLLGRTLWEAFPDVAGSVFEGPYREAMATGRPTSAEAYFAPLGTWFDVHSYPWSGGLMVHFRDIGARKAAEAERERLLAELQIANAELRRVTAVARTEERRARFLADLGHALQPLTEPDTVMETAARLLGEHLGVDRCAYAEVEADEDTFTITGNYTRGDTIDILGRFTFRAFGAEVLRLMRANVPYVVDDAAADPRVTPPDHAAYEQTQIAAVICVPLHKAGRFAAAMAVHQRVPRHWTPDEVDLVVTVVQRCWESLERARAIRRLRESEATLRATSSRLAERTDAAEAAQHEAEQANQAKTDFLATMSHELRTPLNAIAGYAELLELGIHGPVTDQQREAITRIQRSQRHLLGLINDVLNFAKLEAGHVEYAVADVAVRDAVDAIEPLVAPQLRAKAIRYDRALCRDGCSLRADPDKLQQILLNLLSNAIKFTAAGGAVTVRCEERGDVGTITVEDTGIGIAADRLEHVFAPFVQIDRRLNAPHEGTGLGLAISRDLARGMGGELTVESAPGVGSRFTLTLPRAASTRIQGA
ncbi:MAG TPA: PAS domain-containing protein [Gaiellaceae bacterium]|nr:PAS domain-containing protein [Gaiellaceae bacterium]